MAASVELSEIIDNLTAHEASLTMELNDLSAKTKRVGERLKQIQSALSALRDGRPNAKPTRVGDPAQKKRRATPTIIQETATTVLSKHDRLPFEQLLNHVKSELLAHRLSRVGAKSLLADAIKKPAFTINPDQTISAS